MEEKQKHTPAAVYELHDAVRSGSVEECRKLIGRGVDVNLPDSKRRTALHIAAWKGNSELVQCLVSANCNVMAKALDGFTALHFAAASGDAACCQILIKRQKSLMSMRISKGNKTALHLAIAKGHLDVVKCLLESGADITAKTGAGKTVLELASDYVASSKTLESTRIDSSELSSNIYEYIKMKYESYIDKKRSGAKVTESQSLSPPATNTAVDSATPNESNNNASFDTARDSVPDPIVATDRTSHADNKGVAQKNEPPSGTKSNPRKRKVIMAHLEFDEDEDA